LTGAGVQPSRSQSRAAQPEMSISCKRNPNGKGFIAMSVSEQLKAAIEKAEQKGETRYRIAQESRVDYTVLSRFLDLGTDIKLRTVDRLSEYLGLELKPKPAGRK
jgi:hypothetical protein